MKTKVNNCGNYDCAHCSNNGQCILNSIGIGQDGKCITFKRSEYVKERWCPMDEHTNMC